MPSDWIINTAFGIILGLLGLWERNSTGRIERLERAQEKTGDEVIRLGRDASASAANYGHILRELTEIKDLVRKE